MRCIRVGIFRCHLGYRGQRSFSNRHPDGINLFHRSRQRHLSLLGVCAEQFMVKGREGYWRSRGAYVSLSIDGGLQCPRQVISYQALQSVHVYTLNRWGRRQVKFIMFTRFANNHPGAAVSIFISSHLCFLL